MREIYTEVTISCDVCKRSHLGLTFYNCITKDRIDKKAKKAGWSRDSKGKDICDGCKKLEKFKKRLNLKDINI